MTYELCKKLKDNHFAQQGYNGNLDLDTFYLTERFIIARDTARKILNGTEDTRYRLWVINFAEELVFIPSLEQLLWSFGNYFCSLHKDPIDGLFSATVKVPKEDGSLMTVTEMGRLGSEYKTPEEALAVLWIKIHSDA